MLGRRKNKQPALSPEQALEQRVDAMMDPERADAASPGAPGPVSGKTKPAESELPPLDIFSDAKTAPEVPKKLLKELGADAAAEETTKSDTAAPPPEPAKTADTPLDDAATDAAVDDIVAKEGDTVLEVEDAANKPLPKAPKHGRFHIKSLVRRWWFWLLAIVIILGVLAAVPYTRYRLAGLVIQKDFTVAITDSTTHTPISDAEISLAGRQAKTNAAGKATLHVRVGKGTLVITKQYYKQSTQTVTVPLTSQKDAFPVALTATGRQVPVTVVNSITGQPLAGASIKVLNTTAQTNASGMAVIVLPTQSATQSATITLSGYNQVSAPVQVTNQVVAANTFKLTPGGQVYFLSNASGKIDVVKSNLDGSGRQTVLAGTGSEDSNNTVLLPSSDWKYLALLSKRAGGQYPKLYLISTASDQVTTIDQGSFNFSPIGWSGHYFVYREDNPNSNSWQPGGSTIKSYSADAGKANTLASTNATGSSNADAQYENIWNAVLMGNKLVYTKTWYSYPGNLSVSGQQNTLAWVAADGSDAKTLKTVDAGTSYFANLVLVQPNQLDLGVYNTGSASTTYYRLDTSGNVTQSNTITESTMSQSYPAYLLAPSGNQQFWGEIRDGKHTLFVGDQNAGNATTIATASDYAPYAWFTDSYLLVSKNGSELYVMSANGKGQVLKISDYYKPAQNYYGYGGN